MTNRRWKLLVIEHTNLVRVIALRVHQRIPVSIDIDDLIGVGNLALIEVAKKFEARRGIKFSAYATFRIRGAMLDALSRTSSGTDYRFALHEQLTDGSETIASPDYTRDLSSDRSSSLFEWTTPSNQRDLVPSQEASPERSAAMVQLRNRLLQAIDDCLTREEAYALIARSEERSLKEIGQMFGRSTTWAHGIVQSARRKMQHRLGILKIDADAA